MQTHVILLDYGPGYIVPEAAFYRSIHDFVCDIDPADVEEGVYRAFTADGIEIKLFATKDNNHWNDVEFDYLGKSAEIDFLEELIRKNLTVLIDLPKYIRLKQGLERANGLNELLQLVPDDLILPRQSCSFISFVCKYWK